MLFILILVALIFSIPCMIFIAFIADYKKDIKKESVLLSFSQFKKFYTINPAKWKLNWLNYRMRYYTEDHYPYDVAIKSYLEYLFLFKPFRKKLQKKASQKVNNKRAETMLLDIQNDIDKLKKQAQEELQQAANTYVLLAENIYYNKNDKGLYAKDIATDKFYPVAGTIKMGE